MVILVTLILIHILDVSPLSEEHQSPIGIDHHMVNHDNRHTGLVDPLCRLPHAHMALGEYLICLVYSIQVRSMYNKYILVS